MKEGRMPPHFPLCHDHGIVNLRNSERFKSIFFVVLVSMIGTFISACSSTGPAPVVSRDIGPRPKPTRLAKPIRPPTYYIVKRSDTIYSIAWRYGLDYRQFASWNGIRAPYTIYPGRRLRTIPPITRRIARRNQPIKAVSKSKVQQRKSVVATPRPAVKAGKKITKSTNKRQNNKLQKSKFNDKKGGKLQKLRWQWPTQGKIVGTFKKSDANRKGIKISGRIGQAVRSSESGHVVYSGSGLVGYGKLIIVKHNRSYLSAYGHNNKLLVKEGDHVVKGMLIAKMGGGSDGKGLMHFEIRRNGLPQNPVLLLPRKR